MPKKQVLFLGELNTHLEYYQKFAEIYECIHYEITTKDQLIHDFQTKLSEIEAVYGAWEGFADVGGLTDDDFIKQLPRSLKVITVCSVGYDGYDCAKLRERGIVLTHVPSNNSAEQVADVALYMALSSFRYFRIFEDSFKKTNHTLITRAELESDKFDNVNGKVVTNSLKSGFAFGHLAGRTIVTPQGHNVVIVGLGTIGKAIARRLNSIGMNIHYVKRSKLQSSEEAELGFSTTFHETLKDAAPFADLVVFSLPGNADTKHLLNRETIDLLKKPSRVVNVGRGFIIDEVALVESMKEGKIIFAGLDVYEKEPTCHPELLNRDDVILTPHIGSSTVSTYDDTAIFALKNIEDVLTGGPGLFAVN